MSEVPRERWSHVLGDGSCTYSHEFWELIEQSELNDFRYRHALFLDDAGRAVALASFYTITTDIAIFAPAALKGLLARVRRVFPNFLKLRMLECGTPITLNEPLVANPGVDRAELVESLAALLLRTARKEWQALIVARDFVFDDNSLRHQFARCDYLLMDSLPTTYLEITWRTPEAYLASLKSYYRSKLQKHLRINAMQGVRHELREKFDDMAEVLCDQWLVVHHHASEYQREVLTPEFYRQFSLKLGARAKVLLFYRHTELVGHALLLHDGAQLRWLYFGRSQARNDSLYIYAAHKVVETAIELGVSRLEFGLTNYAIKKDLGAQMTPNRMALRSPYWLGNYLVAAIYPLLNHAPRVVNKDVFKAGH